MDRVTWRLEIPAGWGERLDPDWLPDSGTEEWRRIFRTEDLAGKLFAAEDAVADLTSAAATGHIGPDVLDTRVLCTLGHAAHYMIREYRTLFRSAWAEMDGCSHPGHDDDADARLERAPAPVDSGPGGRWHHMVLAGTRSRVVNRHPSRAAAAASVAAARATDGTDGAPVRWTEPAVRTGERS